jgi:CheY-like chemotaxis protein/HPt (histidine-containing phosphotransfer) domain-containing protein
MEAGRIELEIIDFNLIMIVRGGADWLKSAAKGKNLNLLTRIDPKIPPFVKGDPVRLRQVLLNLASNAIKFTDKGTVILTAEVVEEKSDSLSVRFEVSDTGIGLSEASQKRLFQPFSQADGSTTRKYGGTGLGLSISKRLVELMGGEISVESEEAVGSKFWFTVPFQTSKTKELPDEMAWGAPTSLYPTDLSQATYLANGYGVDTRMSTTAIPANNGEQRADGSKHWVLLAEDNTVLQDLTCRQLNKLGFNVKVVSNGQQALEAVSEREYVLILMDCQMPEMDGFETTLEIRRGEAGTGNHVLIVALTASAMPSDRQKCLESGMDDYLSKPVRLQQLNEIVNRWLAPISHQVINQDLVVLSKKTNRLSKDTVAETTSESSDLIDLQQLEKLYGEDSVQEILTMFLDEAKGLVIRIDENMKDRDRKELVATAHQLKGVSAAVLTTFLNECSLNLEGAARKGSWEDAERCRAELFEEFNRVTKFVEMVLNKSSS